MALSKRSKRYRTLMKNLAKARKVRSRMARERHMHRLIEPTARMSARVLGAPVDEMRNAIRAAIERMAKEVLDEMLA